MYKYNTDGISFALGAAILAFEDGWQTECLCCDVSFFGQISGLNPRWAFSILAMFVLLTALLVQKLNEKMSFL